MDNFIIIDLETQSFNVERGIYEVACMVVENYTIVDELYFGFKIEGYVGSTKYGKGFHNIARDIEVVELFKTMLSKYPYPLVAHNCAFDRKFLLHYDWIDETYPTYCSIRAIKHSYKGLKSYSMENLMKEFDIDSTEAHTAFGDVKALFEILDQVRPTVWLKPGEKLRK